MVLSLFGRTLSALFLSLTLLGGCTTARVSPGLTFATGLNSYNEEMERMSGRPERWPDRQQLAESIKAAHLAMLGGSKEFDRLVDVDLRRREYLITLRDKAPTEERAKEMKQELRQMEEQLSSLKGILKAQEMRSELSRDPQNHRIESIATVGLFNLAIDAFGPESPEKIHSTQVGSYVVLDEGAITTVTAPDGEAFRCSIQLISEGGAAITCASTKAKP